ncbi:MAG: NAD(P)H-binding protein [Bacteroidota bacterium]
MTLKAAVFGSTGLVGKALVEELKNRPEFTKIFCYARRPPMFLEEKTEFKPFKTDNFRMPEDADIVFCALGTTIKKAGSQQEFQEVDLHAVDRLAQKTKAAGIKHLVVVSSVGADANSKNFYLRTKGQMEEKVKNAGIDHTVILHPSLLLGKRDEKRVGETIGQIISGPIRGLMVGPLKPYRPVKARKVAQAMIEEALKPEEGFKILENQDFS